MTSQQKFPAFFACLESPFLLSSFGIGSILTHKKNSNTATVPDEMTLYVSPRLGRKSVKPSTVNSVKDRVIVLSR
ncbi:hypothetical protein TWF103_006601 [Orbilia oligospora]|nr:hypothetical protein TWF103_006601 [Orbilia oligospora]